MPEARSTTVGDVCTSDARTLAPEDSVEAAAQAMAENGIRRLPVVDHGKLVGIVSLGDLAQDRDAGPPLADEPGESSRFGRRLLMLSSTNRRSSSVT